LISIKQNETLSSINGEMLKNNMVSNNYSKIIFDNKNYIQEIDHIFNGDYGNILRNKDLNENIKVNYYRIILQLRDEKSLPLVSAKIDNLQVEYEVSEKDDSLKLKTLSYIKADDKSVVLEVTPRTDEETFYLPICLLDDIHLLREIVESKKIKITLEVSITNAFNVTSRGKYTLILHKDKIKIDLWEQYTLAGKKIYFGDINYTNK